MSAMYSEYPKYTMHLKWWLYPKTGTFAGPLETFLTLWSWRPPECAVYESIMDPEVISHHGTSLLSSGSLVWGDVMCDLISTNQPLWELSDRGTGQGIVDGEGTPILGTHITLGKDTWRLHPHPRMAGIWHNQLATKWLVGHLKGWCRMRPSVLIPAAQLRHPSAAGARSALVLGLSAFCRLFPLHS